MSYIGNSPNAVPASATMDRSTGGRNRHRRQDALWKEPPRWFSRELKKIHPDLWCQWGFPPVSIHGVWVILQKKTPIIKEEDWQKDTPWVVKQRAFDILSNQIVMQIRDPFYATCGGRIWNFGMLCPDIDGEGKACEQPGVPMEPSSFHLEVIKAGDATKEDDAGGSIVLRQKAMEEAAHLEADNDRSGLFTDFAKDNFWQAFGHPRLGSNDALRAGHQEVFG